MSSDQPTPGDASPTLGNGARAQPAPPPPGEVTVLELVNVVLRHRYLILLLPLAVGLLFFLLAWSQPRTYTATALFMPQGATTTPRLSGLAAQLGGGAEPAGQSPAFYAELLRTREILGAAVETEYQYRSEEGPVRGTLVELYGIQAEDPQLREKAAVKRLSGAVAAGTSRTGMVRLSVTAHDPQLAEAIAVRLLELLNEFNLERRRSQAAEEARFAEERREELRGELAVTEQRMQEFLRHNRQYQNSPELLFQHDRLQRELALKQRVYSTMSDLFEQSRMDAVRDIPVITVVEYPQGSATANARGSVVRGLVGIMVGLLLALSIAFLRHFLLRARESDDEEFEQFIALRRQALQDLRLRRWVPRRVHK